MGRRKVKRDILCDVCEKCFPGMEALKTHLESSEHYECLQRKAAVDKKEKLSVNVTGFPPYGGRKFFRKAFAQYQKLEDNAIIYRDNVVIITFNNEEIVKKVLDAKIICDGFELVIKPGIVQAKKLPVCMESILRAFGDASTVEEQASRLMQQLQLSTEEERRKFGPVLRDLSDTINQAIKGAQVYNFGSTLTGLAFVDSDLDVFVNLPEYDRGSPENRVKRLLHKSRHFNNIFYVSSAKIPIIKCQHFPSKVSCDLSFKSGLGVQNSQLLRSLLRSDHRLYPLAFFIKCWAKAHGLSGQNRFTNYSLMMLLVFYLQQGADPILPSIAELQKNCEPVLISGWNGAFTTTWPRTTNNKSLLELLHGFFKFCHEFDFALRVICPLTGESYSRVDFSVVEELPPVFERYVMACREGVPLRFKPATIQDPFELTHNIAACVHTTLLISFQELCAEMERICASTPIGVGPDSLLGKLFVPPPSAGRISASGNTILLVPGHFADYALTQIDSRATTDGSAAMQEYWFDKVHSFVHLVLEKYMLFEMSHPQQEFLAKSPRKIAQNDVHDDNIIWRMSYSCIAYHTFYDCRKAVQRSLAIPDSVPFIEREIRVSEHIKNTQGSSKPTLKIKLDIRACTRPCRLELFITNNGTTPDKYFMLVQQFLNMQTYFNRYLNDLIQENKKDSAKCTPKSDDKTPDSTEGDKNLPGSDNNTPKNCSCSPDSCKHTSESDKSVLESDKSVSENENFSQQSNKSGQENDKYVQVGDKFMLEGDKSMQVGDKFILEGDKSMQVGDKSMLEGDKSIQGLTSP